MVDLNPYVPVPMQQRIGPLMMSDKAAEQLAAVMREYNHPEMADPRAFGPVVVASVGKFLDSAYFSRSTWFKQQAVHTTVLFKVQPVEQQVEPVVPLFHMTKNPQSGYTIVTCEEATLPETYYEERVVEEVRVELGLAK